MASYDWYLTARESPWKQNGLPPIVNIMQIAYGFFTSQQGVMSGFKFYSHFPHSCLLCLPLYSHLVFIWFSLPFSLLSSNITAFSAHVASQPVARLGLNIIILSQSCEHPFSVLLRVHKSSFHQAVVWNAKPSIGFAFSLSSSPPAIAASHFVHSLVEHMPKKCISAIFWSNPIIQSSKHRIFTHTYST